MKRVVKLRVSQSQVGADVDTDRLERSFKQLEQDLLERGVHDGRAIAKSDSGSVEKGVGIPEVLLALGTSGAIAAVVDVLLAWFRRDLRREVEFVEERDEVRRVRRVSGQNVSEELLREVMLAAASGDPEEVESRG